MKIFLPTLVILIFCLSEVYCEEMITITTYYPAPYGVYRQLKTTSDTYLATDSGNVGIGTENPQVKLHVEGRIKAYDPVDDDDLATKSYVDSVAGTNYTFLGTCREVSSTGWCNHATYPAYCASPSPIPRCACYQYDPVNKYILYEDVKLTRVGRDAHYIYYSCCIDLNSRAE